MTEFTDELKKLDLAINLPSKTYFAIEEKFKDWQPPKPLVEVPQYIADYIEANKNTLSIFAAFDGPLNYLRVEKGEKPSTIDCKFTQEEIDSMQTGSYEQIEVDE